MHANLHWTRQNATKEGSLVGGDQIMHPFPAPSESAMLTFAVQRSVRGQRAAAPQRHLPRLLRAPQVGGGLVPLSFQEMLTMMNITSCYEQLICS